MIIRFKLFSGQHFELNVNDQDTVQTVQSKIVNWLKDNKNQVLSADQIKLYCGNDKLISTEFFLKSISTDTKKIGVRLKSKSVQNQSDNSRSLASLSIFGKAEKAFNQTALTTHPAHDYAKLLERKDKILTSGAIPRDTFAVTVTNAATIITETKASIIDLSGMTLNCILGLNDPWVKLRQMSYLASDQVHFVTARMGFPLYYSYPQRLHALFSTEGFQDAVINHRQCNGSDVVELAIHAAYNANTNRKKIGSFKGSYHGQNLTAAIVSEHQPARFPFEVNKELFEVPTYDKNSKSVLSQTTQQTLALLRDKGEEFFALILEPIQTRNAVHEFPIEFLRELRTICTEKNICLIFDEIQTGFGWLGSLCVAGSHDVVPDIAVFSKGVTSGHGALSIMVAKPKYRSVDSTFSGKTNAGDVLSLVAADAVLDRLYGIAKDQIPQWLPLELQKELQEGLVKKVPNTTARLQKFLEKIKSHFPDSIGEIKGQGLVRGLEITTNGKPDERLCAWLINRAYENGVYLRQAEHVIIFKPTIAISDQEFELAFQRLATTIKQGEDYRAQCQETNGRLMVAKGHG